MVNVKFSDFFSGWVFLKFDDTNQIKNIKLWLVRTYMNSIFIMQVTSVVKLCGSLSRFVHCYC